MSPEGQQRGVVGVHPMQHGDGIVENRRAEGRDGQIEPPVVHRRSVESRTIVEWLEGGYGAGQLVGQPHVILIGEREPARVTAGAAWPVRAGH
jgi:hypothetical protein